jgi:hypothetical protein
MALVIGRTSCIEAIIEVVETRLNSTNADQQLTENEPQKLLTEAFRSFSVTNLILREF